MVTEHDEYCVLTCCGQPMHFEYEVFGVLVYFCQHRAGHPRAYVNVFTGQTLRENSDEWKSLAGE